MNEDTKTPDALFIVAGRGLRPALEPGQGLLVLTTERPTLGRKAVLVMGKGRARVGIYREEGGAAFLVSLDPNHKPVLVGNAERGLLCKVLGTGERPLSDYWDGAPKAYAV